MPHFIRRLFLIGVIGAILSCAFAQAQLTFGNFAPGVTINSGSFDTSNFPSRAAWDVAFTTDSSTQTAISSLQLALSLSTSGSYGLSVFVTSLNTDNIANSLLTFSTSDTLTTTPQRISLTPDSVFTPSASTTYYLHVDSTTSTSNIRWNYVNNEVPVLSNYYSMAYGSVNQSFLASDRGGYYLTEAVAVPEAAQTGLINGVGALGRRLGAPSRAQA